MEYFKWDAKFSVGIDSIDNQHKKIIELINELYGAFVDKRTDDIMGRILHEMADYAIYHFKYEENLLEQSGYPLTAKHIEEHDAFNLKVNEFKAKSALGKFQITFTVLNYLKDWLANHILINDAKYSSHLKKFGAK